MTGTDEHERGREHVRAMASSLERAAVGEREALDSFARHARDLDRLLREHIAKEDAVLFPMADELLDGAAERALVEDFRRIESDAGGERHREWMARVGALCAYCRLDPIQRSQVPTLLEELL